MKNTILLLAILFCSFKLSGQTGPDSDPLLQSMKNHYKEWLSKRPVMDLLVEYDPSPIAMDNQNPRFTWIIVLEGRGRKQTGYQIHLCTVQSQRSNVQMGVPTDDTQRPERQGWADIQVVKKMARVLGKEEHAEKFKHLALEVKNAFNNKFLNRDDGYYDEGSQAAQTWPLIFGMVPEDLEESVFNTLVKDIVETNDNHPTNTTATVYLPANPGAVITEGGIPISRAKGIKALPSDNGDPVFELGSGEYLFSISI